MTDNKSVLSWIEEMKALVKPDNVVWIDGSEEQLNELREESVKSTRDWGEVKKSLRKVLSRRVAMQPELVLEVLARWEEWAGQSTWNLGQKSHSHSGPLRQPSLTADQSRCHPKA